MAKLSSREIQREFGIGKTTVWRLVRDGKLTPLKLDGRRAVRYEREQVEGLFIPQQRKQEA